ncbi:hypothetical protein KAU45_01535, partial [bacterium]|nr:hypothetical protein [bacterium]
QIPGWVVPIAVVCIVGLGLGILSLSGGLANGIEREEYLARMEQIGEPLYAFRPGAPLVPAVATPYDEELFEPLKTYVSKPRKVLELLPMLDFEIGAAASGLTGGLEEHLVEEEEHSRRTEHIMDTTLRGEETAEEPVVVDVTVPSVEEPEGGLAEEEPPPEEPE